MPAPAPRLPSFAEMLEIACEVGPDSPDIVARAVEMTEELGREGLGPRNPKLVNAATLEGVMTRRAILDARDVDDCDSIVRYERLVRRPNKRGSDPSKTRGWRLVRLAEGETSRELPQIVLDIKGCYHFADDYGRPRDDDLVSLRSTLLLGPGLSEMRGDGPHCNAHLLRLGVASLAVRLGVQDATLEHVNQRMDAPPS